MRDFLKFCKSKLGSEYTFAEQNKRKSLIQDSEDEHIKTLFSKNNVVFWRCIKKIHGKEYSCLWTTVYVGMHPTVLIFYVNNKGHVCLIKSSCAKFHKKYKDKTKDVSTKDLMLFLALSGNNSLHHKMSLVKGNFLSRHYSSTEFIHFNYVINKWIDKEYRLV